jgi:hypothetical protein
MNNEASDSDSQGRFYGGLGEGPPKPTASMFLVDGHSRQDRGWVGSAIFRRDRSLTSQVVIAPLPRA